MIAARPKRPAGYWRAVAVWVIVVVASVGVAQFKDQLGIGTGTLVLIVALLVYTQYSLSNLRERIGLDQLPTLEAMIDSAATAPIVPDHEPSEGIADTGWGITDATRLFYGNFARFADIVNEWLKESPWRLQEVSGTEVSTTSSSGPTPGRRYSIYYGPTRVGRISISEGWKYSEANPEVASVIELYDARRFSGQEVMHVMGSLADHVAFSEERDRNYQMIRNQMLMATWQLGSEVVTNADLTVHLLGSPDWYLRMAERRDEPE